MSAFEQACRIVVGAETVPMLAEVDEQRARVRYIINDASSDDTQDETLRRAVNLLAELNEMRVRILEVRRRACDDGGDA